MGAENDRYLYDEYGNYKGRITDTPYTPVSDAPILGTLAVVATMVVAPVAGLLLTFYHDADWAYFKWSLAIAFFAWLLGKRLEWTP